MLIARPARAPARTLDLSTSIDAEKSVWFALFDPTPDEQAAAAKLTGLRIPTRADLQQIESSNRLFREDGHLYLTTPLVRRREGASAIMPLGLVVSQHVLITIRYADYPSIEAYGQTVERSPAPLAPPDLLVGLLEAIVGRLADVLEIVGAELDGLSARVFRTNPQERSKRADQRMRDLLRDVGRQGDSVSLIRDSMLGLRRLILFSEQAPELQTASPLDAHWATMTHDLQSLAEFGSHLTEKTQFLLDATLGLINVEQNNGIRILTVISLMGIPPTLIASIYGMNFKDIPELSWSFGYWYALTLMFATAVLPLVWFRRVGWI